MLLWMQTPDCQPSNIQLTHPRKWMNVLLGVALVVLFGTLPVTALAGDFPGKGSRAKWEEAMKYGLSGVQQIKEGDLNSAKNSFETAISIYDQDAAFYFNLGYINKKLKHYDLAESSYKHALLIDPNYSRAWINLGSLYNLQEKTKDSLDAYKNALKCKLTDSDRNDVLSFISVLENKLAPNKNGIKSQ